MREHLLRFAPRRLWLRSAAATLLGLGLTHAQAQAQIEIAVTEGVPDPKVLQQWLSRIQEAANKVNYTGIYVVSTPGQLATARILHFSDGRQQWERIEALDGQPRVVLRHNERVVTLLPTARVAIAEQRSQLSGFPAVGNIKAAALSPAYQARLLGIDRVAGLEVGVLDLDATDVYRWSYRLFAERQTGMLLRAEIRGAQGELLESSAFSELNVGIRPQVSQIEQAMNKLDGFEIRRPELQRVAVNQSEWKFGKLPSGFRVLDAVKRPLPTPDGQETHVRWQFMISDGLAQVSVFAEPFSPDLHRKETLWASGATHGLSVRRGEWWLTAMGEVPPRALRELIQALERRNKP